MAIHQVRLPDKAGTPRLVTTETPHPSTPRATSGDAPPPSPPPAPPRREASLPSAPVAAPAVEPDPRAWYRSEAWLAVEMSAVVPVVAALVAPEAFRVPLVALAAALILLGLAMLVVRDRGTRRAR